MNRIIDLSIEGLFGSPVCDVPQPPVVPEPEKFCVNCVNHIGEYGVRDICVRVVSSGISLVTGVERVTYSQRDCEQERSSEEDCSCGPEGKFWEFDR